MKDMKTAVYYIPRQHTHHVIFVGENLEREKFVVKGNPVFEALLVQGMHHGMPRSIRCGTGPAHGFLAKVFRVSAKAPLVDLSVFQPAERHSHVFKFDYDLRGHPAQKLDGILVSQVVASLYRIIHMPQPVIRFDIAQCRSHATLSRNRVRSRGEYLGNNSRIHFPGSSQGGSQTGSPSPHNDYVVLVYLNVFHDHYRSSQICY